MYRRNTSLWLWIAVSLLLLATYFVAPFMTDDWGHMHIFSSGAPEGAPLWPLERWWSFAPFHWLHVNGRAANFLAAYLLGFATDFCWFIAACGAAAMMALTLSLGGVWRRTGWQTAGCVAIAAMTVLLPWWDGMFAIDLNFNYILSLALGLAFIAGLRRGLTAWLLAPFGLLAGCMHEALGLPLLMALTWSMLISRTPWRTLGRGVKVSLVCFAAGVFVVVLSPGIIGRALSGSFTYPATPIVERLLVSAPLYWILFAAFLVALFRRSDIKALMRSAVGFWIVAATASMAFCVISGTAGRSGWFAQIFALTALLIWARRARLRLPCALCAAVTAVCWAVCLVVNAAPLPAISRAGAATDRMLGFSRDSGGIVYVDLPDEHAQPWYTLGRVRCIEPHDVYYLDQMAQYRGYRLIVPMPRENRAAVDSVMTHRPLLRPVTLPDGTVLAPWSRNMPDTALYAPERAFRAEPPGYSYYGPDSVLWVVQPLCDGMARLLPVRPFYDE